ncbi:MAG: imidazolonepropionase [Candidatus Kapabacteria bacterium]|nr:imidazolonepropionase [Candidatus Kapabacteria bacterium]
MINILTNISSLVTINANGKLFKAGKDMQDIQEIKNAAMVFDTNIIWVGKESELEQYLIDNPIKEYKTISADNKCIIPGFVDSHTHIVFAGSRSNEFAKRLRGATYKEIADEGGGIQTTVKATRNASIDDLFQNGKTFAISAIKYGTTALEIKSGYSLNLDGEIKQLEAIKKLKENLPLSISSTFMGAHDIPIEFRDNKDKYIDLICDEMLPLIKEKQLAEFCDVFVDEGYFTVNDGDKIFKKASELGFKLKLHADELANTEAASLAARWDAVSADHLLNVSENGIQNMIKSGTVFTLLPGTAYFIRLPYAPARKIIDKGGILAIASDCNPGSCYTENMQLILSLAVINMNMTAEEALTAATLNGAYALRKSDEFGSIEVGKKANFLILDSSNYADLFYHFGINHVKETWISGVQFDK